MYEGVATGELKIVTQVDYLYSPGSSVVGHVVTVTVCRWSFRVSLYLFGHFPFTTNTLSYLIFGLHSTL